MRKPDVTVIMPIAPRAPWLQACLASLLGQTFDRWDIVAVLDGACRHNEGVLAGAGLGSRLQTIELPERSGVARAMNVAMRQTSAAYVARMDADDICMPERLAVQVEAMEQRPSVWAMGSSAVVLDQAGHAIGFRRVPNTPVGVRRTLLWRNALIHPSVIMRRREVVGIGGYNPSSERMQDYELWLRITAVADLDNLPQALIQYRIHEAQHSRGRRLGDAEGIRRARRAIGSGFVDQALADLRHAVWFGAQVLRDGK